MGECDICGKADNFKTQSCEICHKVVSKYQNKTKYVMKEVRIALNNAYSRKKGNVSYFKCNYTGIESAFLNKNDKLQYLTLTLDHKNPEDDDELVVSLNIINKMKADIPYDDFKKLVIYLGDHFKNNKKSDNYKLKNCIQGISNHKTK